MSTGGPDESKPVSDKSGAKKRKRNPEVSRAVAASQSIKRASERVLTTKATGDVQKKLGGRRFRYRRDKHDEVSGPLVYRSTIDSKLPALDSAVQSLAEALLNTTEGRFIPFAHQLTRGPVTYQVNPASSPRMYTLDSLINALGKDSKAAVKSVQAFVKDILHDDSQSEVHLAYDEDSNEWRSDRVDGKHEWIPCDMIADVLRAAEADQDKKSWEGWVAAFDVLRSETHALIYRPYPRTSDGTTLDYDFQNNASYAQVCHDLNDALGNVLKSAGGDDEAIEKMLQPLQLADLQDASASNDLLDLLAGDHDQLKAAQQQFLSAVAPVHPDLRAFSMSGHSGAIYIGATQGQVTDMPGWHDILRDLFRHNHDKRMTYGKQLVEFARNTIWNGEMPGLARGVSYLLPVYYRVRGPADVTLRRGMDPDEFEAPHVGDPPSENDTLWELQCYQNRRYRIVTRRIASVAKAYFAATGEAIKSKRLTFDKSVHEGEIEDIDFYGQTPGSN